MNFFYKLFLLLLSSNCFYVYGQPIGWNYKESIYLKNFDAQNYQNAQVALSINTASLIAGGKLENDASDLRFMNDSETQTLSYWIEQGINTSNTKVWVKIPQLNASGRTRIAMYYGNANAVSASNGDSTFVFFDDFSTATLNANKWFSYKQSSVSQKNINGMLKDSGDGYASLISRNMGISAPFIIHSKINGYANYSWDLCPAVYAKEDSSYTRVIYYSGLALRSGVGFSDPGFPVALGSGVAMTTTACDTIYEFISKVYGNGACTVNTPRGTDSVPSSANTVANATRIGLWYFYNSGNALGVCSQGRLHDNIFVRKFVTSNPVSDSVGNEIPIGYTFYYSKSTGRLDSLGTWGVNTDGTGTSPANFSGNKSIYMVYNNASPTIVANWLITGTNSGVVFGDGSITLNAIIPTGLSLTADSITIRNNSTVTIQGNIIANKYDLENGSTVQYISTASQNLAAASYYNLIVANSTKTVLGNVNVRSTLTILANINCTTYTLSLGTSAVQTGTLNWSSGTIIGSFSRWFAASTNSGITGLFPIGTSNYYRPLQVEYTTAPSAGGLFTAQFVTGVPGNTGLPLIDFTLSPVVTINKMGSNGYWHIDTSNGLSGGTYICTATAAGFYGISSVASLRLLRRNNLTAAWSLLGTSLVGSGTTAIPVVSRTSITANGGDFGMATDSAISTLPVSILDFSAQRSVEKVILNWSTASELNNGTFEIERSIVDDQWSMIGKVKGNGTTNNIRSYQFIDDPGQGSDILYYRLKQFDLDGAYQYSKVISVDMNMEDDHVNIYPNPANDVLFIHLNTKQVGVLELFDLQGRSVMIKEINSEDRVDVSQLDKGLYFMSLKTPGSFKQNTEQSRLFKIVKK